MLRQKWSRLLILIFSPVRGGKKVCDGICWALSSVKDEFTAARPTTRRFVKRPNGGKRAAKERGKRLGYGKEGLLMPFE